MTGKSGKSVGANDVLNQSKYQKKKKKKKKKKFVILNLGKINCLTLQETTVITVINYTEVFLSVL